MDRAKENPLEVAPVQLPRHCARIQVRRADHLERQRPADADVDLAELAELSGQRIADRRLGRRDVRRGRNPRKPGFRPAHVAAVIFHRYDDELAVDPLRLIQIARQLPGRQAVNVRHRIEPDERLHLLLARTAVHAGRQHRIRHIQHDEQLAGGGRRFHGERHRPDIRVGTAADVLDMADQHVDLRQRLGRRPPAAAGIERIDRQPGRGVAPVADLFPGFGAAADAVFGSEQGNQPETRVGVQQVRRRTKLRIDAGLIRDEPDPPAGQQLRMFFEQHLNGGSDRRGGSGRPRGQNQDDENDGTANRRHQATPFSWKK